LFSIGAIDSKVNEVACSGLDDVFVLAHSDTLLEEKEYVQGYENKNKI
jgi:hypothetical protein